MIKKSYHRFKASEFAVNVSKLTTGTAIAQLISIGTAPVLYRIYDREHYGTLGMYMAITGVLGVFSTLQYLQVIMLEKEDDDAINAMWLNRIINTSFALLVALSLLIFFPLFAKWANNDALSKWFWMIPIGIFFAGQNEIFRVWANRKKEYNLLTFNGIFLAVLTPIISISLGLLFKNEIGLFVGLLVGQSLPALILLIGLSNKYDLGLKKMDISVVKHLFKKNKKFPIYSLPSEFVNRFSNQMPVFMLNHFVGVAVVGDFNLANRLLGLPISFVGGAIGNVFQQRATADFYRFGNYKEIFSKVLKLLLLLSIVPTIIFMGFGKDIIVFVFGQEWEKAGEISVILAPVFALQLINSPLSYGFFIHKLQNIDLFISIVFFVSTFVLMKLMFNNGFEYLSVIRAYSIFFSLTYILLLISNYYLSKIT